MKENWRTYTPEQARHVRSGLQILLDQDLLDDQEKKHAISLQVRLRGIAQGSDNKYAMVPIAQDEEDLLRRVEGALWK